MTPPYGFHLLPGSSPADVGWALGGAPAHTLVKLCDAQLLPVARNLGARTLYRCYPDDGPTPDGAAWAAHVLEQIQGPGQGVWPDICQFRNEVDGADVAQIVASYQAFRAALRAAGYPGLVGLGSYGVGWPSWDQYPALVAAQPDCLLLDEYFGMSVAGSPDLALRHVDAIARGLLPATIPLYITELGADDVGDGTGTHGWQEKMTADAYVSQLAAYRAGCASSVQACFIFADGAPNAEWDSFRTRQTPVEAYIRSTWQGGTMTKGIDVSDAQAGTNWQQVAASGVQVAIIKATEGVGWQSRTFVADWQAAKAAGLVRVAYGFARWDLNADGAAEARYLISVVSAAGFGTGDGLALDIEVPYGVQDDNRDLGPWASAWFGVADPWLGNPAWQYSFSSFFQRHNLTMTRLGKRPLWLANGEDAPGPLPLDWSGVPVLWQHVTTEVVPGVATLVDTDYTDLSADQLRALGKPAAPAPTGLAAEALAYYQSLGVGIAPDHAVFTVGLLPLYAQWKTLAAGGSPLADLEHPGPATAPEYGTTFGGRPAGAVRLQNRIVGVYLTDQGAWRAFAASI